MTNICDRAKAVGHSVGRPVYDNIFIKQIETFSSEMTEHKECKYKYITVLGYVT